ncbi:MAG TPA: anti-sigma factor RsbA family regulatory protein [Gaiellales bacterium]|nr:anti-sigma factor RsbA family regulatory protein [Gaiellales bacterium]
MGLRATFRHEALLYAGEDEFVARIEPFVREGLAGGEAVMVAVPGGKIRRLRERLEPDAGRVAFADMDEIGANPARIIQAWHEFATPHLAAGRPVRGVGEPVSAARSADELVECQRHEDLLNVAFDPGPGWTLVCPYDTTALAPAVIAECRRSHPHVHEAGAAGRSPEYRGLDAIAAPFDAPLPPPEAEPDELAFTLSGLSGVRRHVAAVAAAAGLGERCEDLVIAAHEVAANSVRHGGGAGVLRMWWTDAGAACEIRDAGFISEPLVGRLRPPVTAIGGKGIWLANQLCDLVQVRSSPSGTTVRLRMHR